MGVRQVNRADAAWFAVLTTVFVVSVLWRPPDEGGFVLCVFNRLTGLPCPGCGMTRSFCAIGKGEWARALLFHPLGPAVFAIAVAYWARSGIALLGRVDLARRFDALLRRPRLGLAAAVVLLGVWVARLALLAGQ